MIEAVHFLTAVGQALAAMRFYHAGHATREQAVDRAFRNARDLLERDHVPRFTFADGNVVYHRLVLHELSDWEWNGRFEAAGIQRLEIDDPLEKDEFRHFLHGMLGRLSRGGPVRMEGQHEPARIRWGESPAESRKPHTQQDEVPDEPKPNIAVEQVDGTPAQPADITAIGWILDQVRARRRLPVLEAETVVRSLAIGIGQERPMILPLLQPVDGDQYPMTHACNVAVLAAAFAQHLGFEPDIGHALGFCGLLCDIGNVRIQADLLSKAGKLYASDRQTIEQHPVEGARILIECDRDLDLAAVVAFEHHQWVDGRGYPRVSNGRGPHRASRLVQICDVFDALCSDRPYRGSLPPDVALADIEAEAGHHFDASLARDFTGMVRDAVLQFSPAGLQDGPDQGPVQPQPTAPPTS